MNIRIASGIVGLLLCLAIALAVPQGAAAATAACTGIGNTASVAYSVAGASQTPVSSNTNTITVGNKVDVIVTTTDVSPGPAVVPNQVDVLLHYTITNNGNANQRYQLSAVDLATGPTNSVFGGSTVTDVVLVSAGTATTGNSTGAALVTTATVTAGGTLNVTIKATMAAPPLADGAYDVFALRARTLKVDGATFEANGIGTIDSSAGTCTADIVLGDGAGTDDFVAGANPDGSYSARSAFHVVLNNLTVSKSSVPYWDPINLSASPKAIPGATMEYTVVISNPGSSSATAVTVTDVLAGTLTPVTAAWSSTNGGGVSCPNQAVANIASGGWACVGTGWAGSTLTATIPTLSSGQTATILYQATIN